MWARVPAGETDQSYAERLLESGVLITPGSFFGPGNEEWVRLALVPPLEECQRAMERWAEL